MSDLQLGLAVVGGIVIIAVLAYNKWQEVRLQQRAERGFGPQRDAGLVTDEAEASARHASEGVAANSAVRVQPVPADVEHGRVEHTIEEMDVPAPRPAPQEIRANSAPLDEAIDCVAILDCARPVAGAEALAKAQALLDESLLKPVHWEGLESSGWKSLAPERRYEQLRVGLQLVDRHGAATAEDLNAFFGGLQEVGLALAAAVEYPDADAALAQANALDAFCAEVDVQIGLNVIATATTTFNGTKLRALAESGGMQLGKDGRFHRLDDHGAELFALANMEPMPFHGETLKTLATRGVTVLLDVPRAPGAASTFRLYLDFANQLEHALGGMLVDDNKKPIGQASVESIGAQLENIYRAMDSRSIPAGGPAALRLFS